MYSNEDLERFYFRYQAEALPHGMSLQTFCLNNNVPYNIFSKWYKDTRRKVVEVKVEGKPSEDLPNETKNADATETISDKTATQSNKEKKHRDADKEVRIWVELHMSNGLYLSRKNLNYQGLQSMIEKLEGLC